MTASAPASCEDTPAERVHRASPPSPDDFLAELDQIRADIEASGGGEDLRHFGKQVVVGRLCSLFGYALAWIAPNPVAVALISLGRFTRWVTVAHTTLHRSYDRVPGATVAQTSEGFARGVRRWIDWFDVIEPSAWHEEHNLGHHCYLGDERDPDRVFTNMAFASSYPRWTRVLLLFATALTWKWTYYAPKTLGVRETARERRMRRGKKYVRPARLRMMLMLARSYLPYAGVWFVALPLAFLPLGRWAALSVFVNSVLAELLSNLHSFLVVVPNHTGADLPVFSGPASDRREYVVRQIVGSVNYDCGTDWSDFLTGYIGYQIEHHLWPSMTLLQYRVAQPRVERLCRRYGVPYRRESLVQRVVKMVRVMIGDQSMHVQNTAEVFRVAMSTSSSQAGNP